MNEKNRIIGEQLLLISTEHKIELLRLPHVIDWIMGDLTFNEPEDTWGTTILNAIRPDLKNDQWTNKIGEQICKEILMLLGKNVSYHIELELETDEYVIKTETYAYNTSIDCESVLESPFIYSDIPFLYGKKLLIVCVGGAEKKSREYYGNLPGPACSARKKIVLEHYKNMGIEYIGVTDLLKELFY